MVDKILSSINARLNETLDISVDDSIIFSSTAYKPQRLAQSNFHIIRTEASEKKIAFIDGGQGCIFSAPDLSFHFVRIFGHIMHMNKTVKSLKNEFYLLVRADTVDDDIYYKAEVFPIKGSAPEDFTIDSMDKRIKEGVDRGSITRVCDIIRRAAEIELAKNILDSLDSGDLLVLDGTLEARFQIEEDGLMALYKKGIKHDILISALSKSTDLLTQKGRTFVTVLENISPGGIWYYHPVVEIKSRSHMAEMYFVRLNNKSDFIFRFEIYNEQNLADIGKVAGVLASQSRDLLIPGYPYGLIKADRLARVSESEREYLRTKLYGKLSKNSQNAVKVNDVHGILDNAY